MTTTEEENTGNPQTKLIGILKGILGRYASVPDGEQERLFFFRQLQKNMDSIGISDSEFQIVGQHNELVGERSKLFTVDAIKMFQAISPLAAMANISMSDMFKGYRNKAQTQRDLCLLFQPVLSHLFLCIIPYALQVKDAVAFRMYLDLSQSLGKNNSYSTTIVPHCCRALFAALLLMNPRSSPRAESGMVTLIPWTVLTGMAFGWQADKHRHLVPSFLSSRLPNLQQFATIVRGCVQKSTGFGGVAPLNKAGDTVKASDKPSGATFARIHSIVMRDYCTEADPRAMSQAFDGGESDWLHEFLSRGHLDVQLAADLGVKQIPCCAGYEVPREHSDIFKSNSGVWDRPPYSFRLRYSAQNGDKFALKVMKNILSPSVYSWVWSQLNKHDVLTGEGGRRGCLLYVATNENPQQNPTTFAVGSGGNASVVHLYPSCMGPLQPVDQLLFDIASLIFTNVYDNLELGLDSLEEGVPKGLFRIPVNVIFALIAPMGNPGFGGKGHTDFNVTNGRYDHEHFSKVNLPTKGREMSLTLLFVPPKYVGMPIVETMYLFKDGRLHKVIKPEDAQWETLVRSITGNDATLQGPMSQLHLHMVRTLNSYDGDREAARYAATFRWQASPGKASDHEIRESGIVSPCLEDRHREWEEGDSAKFERVAANYRVYHAGNFATVTSQIATTEADFSLVNLNRRGVSGADPPAGQAHEDELDPQWTCTALVATATRGAVAPLQRRHKCQPTFNTKIKTVDFPFNFREGMVRPSCTVGSRFPVAGAYLHRDVVKTLLVRHQINVQFKATRVKREESGETQEKVTVVRSQLYRGRDGRLLREGFLYRESQVRAAAEMTANDNCPVNTPLSISESAAPVIIVSQSYKNVVQSFMENIEASLVLKALSGEDAETVNGCLEFVSEPAPLVMYGSGGSALGANMTQADISQLGEDPDDSGFVLSLTEGQVSFPKASQLEDGSIRNALRKTALTTTKMQRQVSATFRLILGILYF